MPSSRENRIARLRRLEIVCLASAKIHRDTRTAQGILRAEKLEALARDYRTEREKLEKERH